MRATAVRRIVEGMEEVSMQWRALAHRHQAWAREAEDEADRALAARDRLIARMEREKGRTDED